MRSPTTRPPPWRAPKATPVLRVFVMSSPRKTLVLSPGRSDCTAICLVAWSSATTMPAVATARATPAVAGRISAVDQADHEVADDDEDEDPEHRAQVERARPHPQRRQEAAEQVEVRVGHVLDELEHRVQHRVVGDARHPAQDHPDEDQDEVHVEERLEVARYVVPGGGQQEAHRVAFTTVSTAERKAPAMPASSRVRSPFSVTPPGVATRTRKP